MAARARSMAKWFSMPGSSLVGLVESVVRALASFHPVDLEDGGLTFFGLGQKKGRKVRKAAASRAGAARGAGMRRSSVDESGVPAPLFLQLASAATGRTSLTQAPVSYRFGT